MFGLTYSGLASWGIHISALGLLLTAVGTILANKHSGDLSQKLKFEIKEHVSQENENAGERMEKNLKSVKEAMEKPSFSEFHASFIQIFRRHIEIAVHESAVYPQLVQLMQESDSTSLPADQVASIYETNEVSNDHVDRVTQNFYEFVFGPGQSTTVSPLALETFLKLQGFIDAYDSPEFPVVVDGVTIEDGTDAIAASVATLYDLSLTREQWLIAEYIADYSNNQSVGGMVAPVAYAYRLLQAALLFSGEITTRSGFFIFGSGINFDTYSTALLRGRSRTPMSVSHLELFSELHIKAEEEGRRR